MILVPLMEMMMLHQTPSALRTALYAYADKEDLDTQALVSRLHVNEREVMTFLNTGEASPRLIARTAAVLDQDATMDPTCKLVRRLRERAGWTREAFAGMVGFSLAHIQRLERGDYTPGLSCLREMFRVLKAEFPELTHAQFYGD